jgi:hypothetical protein
MEREAATADDDECKTLLVAMYSTYLTAIPVSREI